MVTVQKQAQGNEVAITVVEESVQPNRTAEPWPFGYLDE